nr:putative ribonuclease H-like domain-containing protein [Tanacetum cinerariifolium]
MLASSHYWNVSKQTTRLKMDQQILHSWLILLQALQVFQTQTLSDKSKTGLGYDSQGFDSQVLENQVNDKYNTGEGYHAVPPPYIGKYMPPKPDLVFTDEHVVSESITSLPNITKSKVKTNEIKLKNVSAPIIEDWVSDSEDEDEIETESKQIKPSFAKEKFVKSTKHVKSPRKSVKQEEIVSAVQGNGENAVKSLACWIWRQAGNVIDHISKKSGSYMLKRFNYVDLQGRLNGCSRHMTRNKSFHIDYQEIDGGFVAFGGSLKGGKITRKGKIRTGKLNFEDVYFVKELKFNLFSVLQMCDKKNSVHFTETECLVLSPDFKLLDESQVLLKVPKQNNMYSFDLKNVAPSGGLTYLFAKAIIDESNLWHRRLGHIKFKNMNKLVRGNLVRGLPSKIFENDHTCVACQKGKQHKASYRTKLDEAINTASYVQNRVLVTKPHNKTPCELLIGRSPNIDFMKPFGCPVTILNTLDHLGKFEEKPDEGFLVGYSVNSKAFRVFNSRTRKVEENLHIKFLENKSNVAGRGLEWLFDIDSPTKSMNYEPFTVGNQTYDDACIEINSSDDKDDDEVLSKGGECVSKGSEIDDQERSNSSTQDVNTAGPSINNVNTNINTGSLNVNIVGFNDKSMPTLEETGIFDDVYDHREVGIEADTNNLELIIVRRTNHKDYQNCLFAYFLSQQEPKKVIRALTDLSWIEAMRENLLQFKLQKVWTLVDLPNGKRVVGTKWVFRNKKDDRGIIVRNKARLVAQGYTHEKGIDYDEVFAPVARIEAIRLFLAYASFIGFILYQMDVKSAFMYCTIEEEVYVCQPPGFKDPHFPNKIYKVEKALYGLHQAPRAWYETLSTYLLENGFRRGTIDKTLFIKKDRGDILLVHVYVDDIIFGSTKKFLRLQVKQKDDGIFISQDKYVADILKKFNFTTVKTTSTPMKPNNALIKDAEAEDVDVHLYRSMIGSLMYLIASRPDIMFDVFSCARFQVTPKIDFMSM